MKKSRKEVIFFNKNLEFYIYIYICPLLLAKMEQLAIYQQVTLKAEALKGYYFNGF